MKKEEGIVFNKIFILISLMLGSIAFADTASDQIQDAQNLIPFPESITVNFIDEYKGELVIKLRTQEYSKRYIFSKLRPKKISAIQYYKKGYVTKEDAEVSFSSNTIRVDLQWEKLDHYLDEKGEIAVYHTPSSPTRYELILSDNVLKFKRTVKRGKDEKPLVFTAFYSEVTPSDQVQNIRSWTLQEVILNPDSKELLLSTTTTPFICTRMHIPGVCAE